MSDPVFFERLDDTTFRPTGSSGGAWDPDELHFSPLGGLLAHELNRHAAATGPGLQLARLSHDILGKLAREPYTIAVRTVRPGRTIELLEAEAAVAGRTVVRSRAWYLASGDTSAVAGADVEPMPHPGSLPHGDFSTNWGDGGGYIRSLEIRVAEEPRPGRARAWLRSSAELLAGETDAVASFLALIDTANGVAVRAHPAEWIFPNVDLTAHLFRAPAGPWVGLDVRQNYGPTGLGVTSTVLHDVDGPVGTVEQSLTLRPSP